MAEREVGKEVAPVGGDREFVMRPVDPEKDAAKLAAMWNASDDQWPGTWSRGVAITEKMVAEWLEREARLEASVWDDGENIAGYCSVWRDPEEPGVAYIALINVAPQFQGRSLARKALVYWVDRVAELGYSRLDLHTWAGNIKAVPLYKKTGFFWMPDADSGGGVHMLNFMPALLSMPLTRGFFEKNHWYSSLRRELSQTEDDERWEGMKVFTYRFEAEGQSLTFWADRMGRRISAVETDELHAAAIAPETEPARGLPASITWRVRNKTSRPMRAALVASGSEYLTVDHREALEVSPGQAAEVQGRVSVAEEVSDVKVRRGKPSPVVTTALVFDGGVIELGTGMRPRRAVEVRTDPSQVTLAPGVQRTVHVQLRNRLKEAAEVSISITPAPGLSAGWTTKTVSLGAEDFGGVPVTLSAERGGVYEFPITLQVRVGEGKVRVTPDPRAAFAFEAGDFLFFREKYSLRIESPSLRVVVGEIGAGVALTDPGTGRSLGGEVGYAGPPDEPSEFWEAQFELSYESRGSSVLVTAKAASRDNPGLVLHKTAEISPAGISRIHYTLENQGESNLRLQIYQWLWGGGEVPIVTLPLRSGITQGRISEFPGPSDDDFKKPTTFSESWVARESGDSVFGFVWPADTEEIQSNTRRSRFYDCPPRSRIETDPVHLLAGSGGWKRVRAFWRSLSGHEFDDYRPEPPAEPFLLARLDPPVPVADASEAKADLVVENRVTRKLSGSVRLVLPEGWSADRSEFDLKDLDWKAPARFPVAFTATGPPGGATGRVEVSSPESDGEFEVPLVRLGDGSEVVISQAAREDHSMLTVANGRLEFEVAPGFGASIVSLREGGKDHLLSSFPKATNFGWLSPWYGGVSPFLIYGVNFPGKLWQETFEIEEVTVSDGRGLAWRGVRQAAVLKGDPEVRGLEVEFDALTVGGSPVVKLIFRVLNTTTSIRRDTAGFQVFVAPGADTAGTVLHFPDQEIKRTTRSVWMPAHRWAAAENPHSGVTVILASPVEAASGASWGAEGSHLSLSKTLKTPPEGSIELIGYLAVAPDLASARQLVALQHLE